jgi:hypothetical protein
MKRITKNEGFFFYFIYIYASLLNAKIMHSLFDYSIATYKNYKINLTSYTNLSNNMFSKVNFVEDDLTGRKTLFYRSR